MRIRWQHLAVPWLVFVVALAGWTQAAAKRSQDLPIADTIVVSEVYSEVSDRLHRNETLTHLLNRHQIEGGEVQELLAAAEPFGLNPRRLTPAQTFNIRYALSAGGPVQIRTRLGDDAYLELNRDEDGNWVGRLDPIEWRIVRERVNGVIELSLNDAVHAAVSDTVLPYVQRDRLIWNVAEDVYGWVVDFTRDLRPGDEYDLIYERLVSSEGDIRFGRLLAAEIQTGGRTNRAYVMSDDRNRNVYYDDEGLSLRRGFLRYPVQFRRISGGFGRRFHPVLQRYRAHLGTDYAADRGTPIYATADGVVRRAGRWGGYGLVVTLAHPKDIETRYAHMNQIARGIRPGTRVTQGQVIGYVGMTGLATGPHVHYEFLKNGQHVNPRRVDLGDGEPVAADRRAEFERLRESYAYILERPIQARAQF